MKKFTSVALALIMLLGCFAIASCGEKAPKIKVSVFVYSDNACEYSFVIARDMEMDEGTTVLQAVDNMCALKEASYTLGTDGQFLTFTSGSDTIEGSDEKLANGNVVMNFFGWKLNGTLMTAISDTAEVTNPAEKVLVDGDQVVIFMQREEVTPAKE